MLCDIIRKTQIKRIKKGLKSSNIKQYVVKLASAVAIKSVSGVAVKSASSMVVKSASAMAIKSARAVLVKSASAVVVKHSPRESNRLSRVVE